MKIEKDVSLPVFARILLEAEQKGMLDKRNAESIDWFRRKVNEFQISGDEIKRPGLFNVPINPVLNVGEFFTFEYDAKHAETLPYWDRFPFALIVGPADRGFYGLNFHYLSPKMRAELFQNLLKLSVTDFANENERIAVTYELLKSYSRYKYFRPCFKHYLFSHVGALSAKIYPIEWQIGLFLNTEYFEKMPSEKVWQLSKEKIKNRDK